MTKSPFIYCFFFSLILLFACSHSEGHDDHDHNHEAEHIHEHDHDHEHGHDEAAEIRESHEHPGAFVMDDARIKKFGIEFDTLSPSHMSSVIKIGGKIDAAVSDIATITARKSGIFTLAPGVTDGASVNKGATIGTISSQGLQGGDQNAAAAANLEAARREFERLTPLYKDKLVTASAYNEAKRAYEEAKALSSPSMKGGIISESAPFSGRITSIMVSSGQYVEMGTPLATVAKNSMLTLRGEVPSRFASSVPKIKTANFRTENSDEIFSLDSLQGHKISSDININENGFIPIAFSFINNGALVPGSFVEIFLIENSGKESISVPKSALLELQGNKYVYIVEDGHAYEKRLVKTGNSDGERFEITDGLREGEIIVSKGASIVRMAETSAIAPPSHNHNH